MKTENMTPKEIANALYNDKLIEIDEGTQLSREILRVNVMTVEELLDCLAPLKSEGATVGIYSYTITVFMQKNVYEIEFNEFNKTIYLQYITRGYSSEWQMVTQAKDIMHIAEKIKELELNNVNVVDKDKKLRDVIGDRDTKKIHEYAIKISKEIIEGYKNEHR